MINGIKISQKDNVVVCTVKLTKGDTLSFDEDGSNVELKVVEDIPVYHKVAIKDIKKGEFILKYGEHIGVASKDIVKGSHVHLQNVSDYRENLEEKE